MVTTEEINVGLWRNVIEEIVCKLNVKLRTVNI
jgi:hypothetical protein